MSANVKLTWTIGVDRGLEDVDLDTLTPKARALAEAIAERVTARITIKSVRPMRDLYKPGDAEFIVGADSPKLDEPMIDGFESWAHRPATGGFDLHEMLEYECRKFPGWYPVRRDGTDLPSSQAAREDDGITADQAMTLLAQLAPCGSVDKDTWMRKATKGIHGYPRPARHNGYRSLWSERDVRAFAEQLARTAAARKTRQAAAEALDRATDALKADALTWLADGATEVDVAALCGVTVTTVRDWQGKPRRRVAASARFDAVEPEVLGD